MAACCKALAAAGVLLGPSLGGGWAAEEEGVTKAHDWTRQQWAVLPAAGFAVSRLEQRLQRWHPWLGARRPAALAEGARRGARAKLSEAEAAQAARVGQELVAAELDPAMMLPPYCGERAPHPSEGKAPAAAAEGGPGADADPWAAARDGFRGSTANPMAKPMAKPMTGTVAIGPAVEGRFLKVKSTGLTQNSQDGPAV
jgi:hypothetical protein